MTRRADGIGFRLSRRLEQLPSWTMVLLLVVLSAIATRKIIWLALIHPELSCQAFNDHAIDLTSASYNLGVLAPNYAEHGFIRRGLGGTVLAALGRARLAGCVHPIIVFHALSALWLALPLTLLLSRRARVADTGWLYLAGILVVSPQLFWAWGADFGRVDMAVGGFIAFAALAAANGRTVGAMLVLLAGGQVHELAEIYGVPLVVAIWLGQWRAGTASLRQIAGALAVLGAGLAALAHALLTTAATRDLVASVLASGRQTELRDIAAYMTVAGGRSIATSWCMVGQRAATPLYVIGCFAVVACYWKILLLPRASVLVYAVATALPMAVISLVAIDFGRWLMMAVLNGWILAAVVGAARRGTDPASRADRALAAAVLAALIALLPTTVYAPNRRIDVVARLVWGGGATARGAMDACDPSWRVRFGIPAAKAAPG